MGVISKKYVEPDCLLGIWHITEDFDTLMEMIHLDKHDHDLLLSFKNKERQIEWLSVRCLLKCLLNKSHKIVYDERKKPFIMNSKYNISISHSKKYTSVLLSEKKRIGIDIEYMSHTIHKIKHKFINDSEYLTKDTDKQSYHMYIHWCAKEALYKICDKHNLNFKDNLLINPFEPQYKGEIEGTVESGIKKENFTLHYFNIEDYIFVWTCKEKIKYF